MFLLLMTMVPTSADDLLRHGRDELARAQYAEAAKDLDAAAGAFLTPQQTAAYVRTGHYDALASYETALVYLIVADMKLGRVDDARAALRRINIAERIEPTYQGLPLDAGAAEFEPIVQKLQPEMPLPPNRALAEIRGGRHRRADVA